MMKCLICNDEIENDEEMLWGHIQLDHPDIFEEVQNWDSPYMIEEYYMQSEVVNE